MISKFKALNENKLNISGGLNIKAMVGTIAIVAVTAAVASVIATENYRNNETYRENYEKIRKGSSHVCNHLKSVFNGEKQ